MFRTPGNGSPIAIQNISPRSPLADISEHNSTGSSLDISPNSGDESFEKAASQKDSALPFVLLQNQQPIYPCVARMLRNQANRQTIKVCDSDGIQALVGTREKRKLRFLLTMNNEMKYGHEGTPGVKTPAHMQLAGETAGYPACFAAGNITLHNGRVFAINNKSGDYHPGVQGLQFALAAMLRDGVLFADNITISELIFVKNSSSLVGENKYEWPLSTLKSMLKDLGHAIDLVVKQPKVPALSPATTTTSTPASEPVVGSRFRHGGIKRRALYLDILTPVEAMADSVTTVTSVDMDAADSDSDADAEMSTSHSMRRRLDY